jgi:aspartyl-tRNA synthetase
MAGESNIREVIAFPKSASGVDLMCDAPSAVEAGQLEELGLEVRRSKLEAGNWKLETQNSKTVP